MSVMNAIGLFLFIAVCVVTFFNMYEVRIVKETKEKLPNGNWTVTKNISYRNYNTVRHNRQRRIS